MFSFTDGPVMQYVFQKISLKFTREYFILCFISHVKKEQDWYNEVNKDRKEPIL